MRFRPFLFVTVVVFYLAMLSPACVLFQETPCKNDADCPGRFVCFSQTQCIPPWLRQKPQETPPNQTLDSSTQEEPFAAKEPTQDGPSQEAQPELKRESIPEPQNNTDCSHTDNTCPCLPEEEKPCGPQKPVGECQQGKRKCDPNGLWGPCVGEVLPTTELCNGKDDDCNGQIDDLPPKSCYTGPKETQNKGTCQDGLQSCQGGAWSSCSGETLPSQETCDGKDHNCDGKIDNGCTFTYAGDGTQGFKDGPALSAQFRLPSLLSIDAQGNLYVVDLLNGIRKIDTNGMVSTILKNQSACGLFVDKTGSVYTSTDGSTIQSMDPSTLKWSLFAGVTGVKGHQNGLKNSATFSLPCGFASDSSGNLFVADLENYAIRKIDSNGNVSTFAGGNGKGYKDGDRNSAQMSDDIGQMSFDQQGNLWFSDKDGSVSRLRKIDPQGKITTLMAPSGSGAPITFQLGSGPYLFALDAQEKNLYFTHANADVESFIDHANLVTNVVNGQPIGSKAGYKNGPTTTSQFDWPSGLVFDKNGALFVADHNNNLIRKVILP